MAGDLPACARMDLSAPACAGEPHADRCSLPARSAQAGVQAGAGRPLLNDSPFSLNMRCGYLATIEQEDFGSCNGAWQGATR